MPYNLGLDSNKTKIHIAHKACIYSIEEVIKNVLFPAIVISWSWPSSVGGGRGGAQQVLVRKSGFHGQTVTFHIPLLAEKVTFSYTVHRKYLSIYLQ